MINKLILRTIPSPPRRIYANSAELPLLRGAIIGTGREVRKMSERSGLLRR